MWEALVSLLRRDSASIALHSRRQLRSYEVYPQVGSIGWPVVGWDGMAGVGDWGGEVSRAGSGWVHRVAFGGLGWGGGCRGSGWVGFGGWGQSAPPRSEEGDPAAFQKSQAGTHYTFMS